MAELVQRRHDAMGAAYRLFYSQPLEFVRGHGTRLVDAEGNEYLDAYNNVPTAGHSHPRVVDAICEQARTLNTHTRYVQESLIDYSERLLRLFPESLDNVLYTCTGSEANDLALRIAKQVTGGSGVLVTTEAYHGITTETAAISPSLGGPESIAPWVRLVPAPDAYRPAGDFVASVRLALNSLADAGIKPAAFIVDTIFASDGILTPDPSVLEEACRLVRAAGALVIADEVQAGFGRLGDTFWGFQGLGVEPDLVTLGKPMGSGQPIAAVVAGHRLIDTFGSRIRYFSTFAANGVAIAAAQATLDVIQEENLDGRAEETGFHLITGLRALQKLHPSIGDVRGRGLFLGIDLVTDPEARTPAGNYAFDVVNAMRDRRVLIAAVGAGRNVLKIRPPMSFDRKDADLFLAALDESLTAVPMRRDTQPAGTK
jgi:4-aminobutyrate aminotransferase-like enzyme